MRSEKVFLKNIVRNLYDIFSFTSVADFIQLTITLSYIREIRLAKLLYVGPIC